MTGVQTCALPILSSSSKMADEELQGPIRYYSQTPIERSPFANEPTDRVIEVSQNVV